MADRTDEEGLQFYFQERRKLDDLLLHKELYWQQRAKAFWLKEGYTNSKYFHAHATSRKELIRIQFLKNNDGIAVTGHAEMCTSVSEYYKEVFAGSNG